MDKILFINQETEGKNCGIGLIGKLIGDALASSEEFDFVTVVCENLRDLQEAIASNNPRMIIYNYHDVTTPWVGYANLTLKYPEITHLLIHHDFHQERINNFNQSLYHGFKYIICHDPTLKSSESVFAINRLIPNCQLDPYVEKERPIIGFQGFGARHKGIHKIAMKTVEEFDAAILKLHIPPAYYGASLQDAQERVREAQYIVKNSGKKNIDVIFSHELLTTEELIISMSQNTINCYFNDYLDGAGLASSTDYALAARRPIALTKSHQFRNFFGSKPSIFIEDNSLKDIVSFGTKPLEQFYKSYSQENVVNEYEKIIKNLIII